MLADLLVEQVIGACERFEVQAGRQAIGSSRRDQCVAVGLQFVDRGTVLLERTQYVETRAETVELVVQACAQP